MYIVVEHQITDPGTFWQEAESGMSSLPDGLNLHQVLPNRDGSKAVCLWEASSEDAVREFVDAAVGRASSNTYFAVQAENAVGLPSAR